MIQILTLCILSFLFSCSQAPSKNKKTLHSSNSPTYSRSLWRHWTDENKNCLNTRHEILKDRSEIQTSVIKRGKDCYVTKGLWSDYYYPEKLTAPKKIDIDHLIPLKHAHDIGGYMWDEKLKEKFANDPENLVITNRKYNRQKGVKTIAQWLPINFSYACKYYKDWMKIKKKYDLPISKAELNALDPALCP